MPSHSPRVRNTPSLRARSAWLALLLAGSCISTTHADPGTPKPADAQAQAVKGAATSAIDKASGWTAGAIDWMAKKGRSLKDSSNSWRERAENKLKSALDDVMSAPAPPTGLRVLMKGEPMNGANSKGPTLFWSKVGAAGVDGGGRAVVVLVHGLDEPGGVWGDLAPSLLDDGRTVVRFDYADDQPIAQSATDLAGALKTLRAAGVERVVLVGHSMGGLVARDALTRDTIYAGDASAVSEAGRLPVVERLIMVGTPHRGAPLARLRFVAEAREHLVRWYESDGLDPRELLGFLKDGAGEAGTDLLPGSAYLTDLNARPLPKNVIITNIIGAATREEAEWLASALDSAWIGKILSEAEIARARAALADLAAMIGDGVVSIESATLEGVEDQVQVKSEHRFMLRTSPLMKEAAMVTGQIPRQPSAVPVIRERLSK